jgi:hypothetical protein
VDSVTNITFGSIKTEKVVPLSASVGYQDVAIMSPSLLFTDVRVFTGTEVLEKAYVAIENGHITSVGTSSPPQISGATIMSKAGHTLLPGFIDAHIHADKGKTVGLTQSLRFGVTTVMDMHNETNNVLNLKKFAKDNVSTSADIKAAGVAATIDGGWPVPVVTAHDKSEEVSFQPLRLFKNQKYYKREMETSNRLHRPKPKLRHGPNSRLQTRRRSTWNSTSRPQAAPTTSS